MESNIKKCSSKSLKELIKMGGSNNSIELARIYADRYGKTKSASNLLYNYYHLVTNTKFLKEDIYDFFVNGLSYKELEEKYHRSNYNNIIARTVKKVFDSIGNDPYYAVRFEELTEEEILAMDTIILQKIKELGLISQKGIKGIFTIDFEKYSKVDKEFNANVTDDLFEEISEVLKPFVTNYQRVILDQLEPEHFGYIYQLLVSPEENLSAEDIRRKKQLEIDWMLR